MDQLTKGHLGKTHAEVGQEDFVRDVRRNLGSCNCNDDGGHKRKDVFHCNANGGSTEALRCKVIFAVADDDNLRSDEVCDTYPACDRHCENHGPEARGEQHNKNGNQQNVRNIADNVVDNHHDGIDFFGETPKCADGDADSHVDKCADKCKGEGNLRTVPNCIESGLAGTAGTENGMQAEAPFVDRLCGTQVLCG